MSRPRIIEVKVKLLTDAGIPDVRRINKEGLAGFIKEQFVGKSVLVRSLEARLTNEKPPKAEPVRRPRQSLDLEPAGVTSPATSAEVDNATDDGAEDAD